MSGAKEIMDMYTSNLRKAGDSVMLAVPPAFLDLLQLKSGSTVNLESGRLTVQPQPRKQYSLQELLAQCDTNAPLFSDDKDWTASAPVGREFL